MERENIARAAKGDANAFETLMGAYEKKIYALCLRMMGNPHDGEDAAQEAMLRIWRTIGQYRFESAFSTWVYRVTASCCMDAIRKRQRHEQPSLEEMGEASGFDPADGGETPQEQTERKETRSAIQQAIAAVPEGMREVFRTLYERERAAAREKAAAEASEIFSQCPVCGRLVCDRCFLICEDLDLCTACAEALQVRGDVVAGETPSPREFPAEAAGRISTEGDETT